MNPLSFTTQGPPWTVTLPRDPVGTIKLTVYPVLNLTDAASCDAFDHLRGSTVLIDGSPKVVHSVETYRIGGIYRAGLLMGLAVEEKV